MIPSGMTAAEMSDGLNAGRWTALDLVNGCIARAVATNETVSSFVEIHTSEALAEATRSDERRNGGAQLGPLDGIPVAVKDAIGIRGHDMIAGSGTAPVRIQDDADIVRKLRRAGAVILGRTRLHELAYGASGLNDFDGGARNPSYPDRLTGGSSSGSAAAVAAGVCPIAIGTDTGGSIRVPATLCGVVGFKPTYSLLSTEGVLPLAPTLDHLGFLARTVGDIELTMAAVSGFEERVGSEHRPQHRLRVLSDPQMPCETAIADAFERSIARLASQGWVVETLELPPDFNVMELSTTIMAYEAYHANRSRLDREGDRLGPDVRERLESGAAISERSYSTALGRREEFRNAMRETARRADVFASPAIPFSAPSRDEGTLPDIRRRLVQNTRLQNLLGMPAITIPGPGEPAPWALQFSALWDQDDVLLETAKAAESDLCEDPR